MPELERFGEMPSPEDPHMPSSIDWTTVQIIERDICYLYHELAPYGYIMGDLAWGSVYALPYWDFLSLAGLDVKRTRFICEGSLVAILAMAFESLDGSGSYGKAHMGECRRGIESLTLEDPRTKRLAEIVRVALDTIAQGRDADEELEASSRWVHTEFVRGYFHSRGAEGGPTDCCSSG